MRRRVGRDPKKLRGAARMVERGYKKVDVWADNAERLMLVEAARRFGLPLSTFIRRAAVVWATLNQLSAPPALGSPSIDVLRKAVVVRRGWREGLVCDECGQTMPAGPQGKKGKRK